ncbi:MAG: PD-(D/E)XK nuclease family protein [Burkholderiales bacterium]|nr:PD-(D/E)XK nuclease family protein [Burkholderiales bacterium]
MYYVRKVLHQLQLHTELVSQARPRAAALMPSTLSASGLNSLVACPYQFFAGRMLKLFAMDEFSDRPEKRDYGDWLHAILKTYHDKLVADQISLQADRVAVLREISESWFGRILKQSPAALGYSERWKKVIPAYVDWANQREQDGWQFAFGEVWGEHRLQWADGEVLLRGRIDRIDERALDNGDTERAVLDYKTRAKTALRARLKSGEDHQLAFYGLLQPKIKVADQEQILDVADSAHYVALELEREKTGDCEAEQFSRWKQELEDMISSSMQSIAQNAELPAQGVEKVCAYCDMRGLCRKGAW